MDSFSRIDQSLSKFANQTPAEGAHIGYLQKAHEAMDLYGDVLIIMEDDKNPENEAKVEALASKIEEIIG